MAGEIQLNGTSFASESGGTITVNNATLGSAVNFGSIANDSISGDKINGGTISNATLDSTVTFPAIGQLAFWHGYTTSSSVAFTLDGVSSYTVFANARNTATPFNMKNLTFIIDSSNGTITSKTDNWGADINESFSTPTLTITAGSGNQLMSILIFKGAITEGT